MQSWKPPSTQSSLARDSILDIIARSTLLSDKIGYKKYTPNLPPNGKTNECVSIVDILLTWDKSMDRRNQLGRWYPLRMFTSTELIFIALTERCWNMLEIHLIEWKLLYFFLSNFNCMCSWWSNNWLTIIDALGVWPFSGTKMAWSSDTYRCMHHTVAIF